MKKKDKSKEVWKGMLYLTNGILYDYSDRFLVSDQGNVKRTNGKWPNIFKDKDGYLQFSSGTHNQTNFVLHRAIASTFIPNPEGLPQVNHKYGDKDDCSSEMLEWCTAQYNTLHAHMIGLYKKVTLTSKEVLDIRDAIILNHRRYGINHLSDRVGVSAAQVRRVCLGEHWMHVLWKPLEDSNFIKVGHFGGTPLFCDLDGGFIFKIIIVDANKEIVKRRRIHNIKVKDPVEIKDVNVDVLGYILTSNFALVFNTPNEIQARPFNAIMKDSDNPKIKLEKSLFWNY